MVFASPVFLFLFLPLTLVLYWLARSTDARNMVLLAMSLLFYAWGEGGYTLLMLTSIGLNYVFGLLAEKANGRRAIVVVAVTVNLALLAFYKYAGFIVQAVNPLLHSMGIRDLAIPSVHLPIGISFYTFHALSYIIDVSRGQVPAQRKLHDLALYITLFPQLIAGPIVRYKDIFEEIESRRLLLDDFAAGVSRFIVGLGKKVLIANTVAVPVDGIHALPLAEVTTPLAWLAAICYALQIYFDFSAYSDMALGLGRMFGIHFCENFNYPYVSTSVQEFWRRWHISLSTWFRDYLYIPLGGNRHGSVRTGFNLLLVFFLCGLWHGAAWSFIAWGLYHGAFLVIERVGLGAKLERLPKAVSWSYTTLVWIFGWVLFRADTFHHAGVLMGRMIGLGRDESIIPTTNVATWLDARLLTMIVIGAIGMFPVLPWLKEKIGSSAPVNLLKLACALSLFVVCIASLANRSYNPFIYFRF